MFPWGCFMVSHQTSASFSYTLSINQCFMPLTTNLTPLLVRNELQDGLALENMLVMPSPTNSLIMTPRKSSTDLLSDPQILPIPTSIWYLMEGRAPRPPNQLSLSGLGKMIVNLLPNPWQNTTLMILLTFLLRKNEQGERLRATIKRKVIETSKLLDNQHDNAIDKINFHLDVGQGRAEAIMSYVQILDHLDHQEHQEDLYMFRAITGHQGPFSPQDENYKGSKYNVMVEWETGEITDEPLSLIATDDPVTCAEYAKKHDLLHLDGWKRLKHIAKNQKQLTRAINQSKIRQVRRSAVYQFGFLIPKDYNLALQLDEQNGNSKWYDATKLEMDQINEYKVFQDHGKAQYDPKSRKVSNAPNGYQKIRVHLIFAVKHDGRHKARLVAGGHLTPDPIESIYSGIVSIRSLRLVIFLAKLNNLEVWGADIGNAYLEAKTKERLYIVAGPEFEELEGHILVIYKALYGLKSSGLRWSQKIHDIMLDMGFSPSKADPCVWLRKAKCATKYEYVAIYVDDLLIACDCASDFIHTLKRKHNLKIKGEGPLKYHQ